MRLKHKEYCSKNKDKIAEQKKKADLKRAYNISWEEYNILKLKQDNKCAICGKLGDNLDMDHDHFTGENRGLLCRSCNLLLGHAGDNVQILLNAIKYLEVNKYV